jgi:hypothetical protein
MIIIQLYEEKKRRIKKHRKLLIKKEKKEAPKIKYSKSSKKCKLRDELTLQLMLQFVQEFTLPLTRT